MINPNDFLSDFAGRIKPSAIREIFEFSGAKGVISFAGGYPYPKLFPIEQLASPVSLRERYGDAPFQYGVTNGEKCLRSALADIFNKEGSGNTATENNILVTTASQQGLFLAGTAFINTGDTIMVELPTYLGGLQVFEACGAKIIGIPVDDQGIKTDALEEQLKKSGPINLLYLVPDFQNPTGATLSMERRHRIIRLSDNYGFLILEDTPYRDLRFEGGCLPSLASMDWTGNVISARSFSKILLPGMRVGWIVAEREIIDKLALVKQSADLLTSPLDQYMVYDFIKRDFLASHIERLKLAYETKRDAMLCSLDKFMPKREDLYWSKPQGGLFLWLTLPKDMDAHKLFLSAVKNGVAFVPGVAFHCNGEGRNTLRLNYSLPVVGEIIEGVERLAKMIKSCLC